MECYCLDYRDLGMDSTLLLILLGIGCFAIILVFLILHFRTEQRARELHARWRADELSAIREQEAEYARRCAEQILNTWKAENEDQIRRDAISRSRAVLKGHVTEHLLAFTELFPYNPSDARFLGTPVDLIVFNGLSAGRLEEIVFVEVKSGKHSRLSEREGQVRETVTRQAVRYEVIHTG